MDKVPALEVKNISKRFPGVLALDNVSFTAYEGEMIGLLGVNGAGKSTLMNVLGGLLAPDEGEVYIRGEKVEVTSPAKAAELGIAFIQQEIQLFTTMRVYENIFINELNNFKKGNSSPFLDRDKLKKETKKYLLMLGCEVDPNAVVNTLSTGEQQMVQIARALSQGGTILLFDEPTSSLSLKEKERLFEVMEMLKKSNILMFFISHYLDEIEQITDRVIVMRDGCVVKENKTADMSTKDMVAAMLKDNIEITAFDKKLCTEPIMRVEHLKSRKKSPADVSFTLNKGEVLGIWGLLGSGRTETIRSIIGYDPIMSGEFYIADEETLQMEKTTPAHLKEVCGYVTESRHFDGLYLNKSLWENVTSINLDKFCSKNLKILDKKNEQVEALKYIREINVKTPDENVLAQQLSGGNQQKVVIAKWLMKRPRILFLDEPTRGVDVGAKFEIQRTIRSLAEEGMSIVVVSSELDEIISVSDRIIVLYDGCVSAVLDKDEINNQRLMHESVGG